MPRGRAAREMGESGVALAHGAAHCGGVAVEELSLVAEVLVRDDERELAELDATDEVGFVPPAFARELGHDEVLEDDLAPGGEGVDRVLAENGAGPRADLAHDALAVRKRRQCWSRSRV